MKLLITRCTLWDMAGVAMIRGLENGLRKLGVEPETACLLFPQNDNPQMSEYRQFHDQGQVAEAIEWCDIAVDLGGVCKGWDPFRDNYIKICRRMGKPYVYGAQSFENPHEDMVKGIPAVARGHHAATQLANATGEAQIVGADCSFLLELPKDCPKVNVAYTTHFNKPWIHMRQVAKTKGGLQVRFKKFRSNREWEPLLDLPKKEGPTVEDLFGAIACSDECHTARYHAAVAAIMGKVPVKLYVTDSKKYEDLLFWKGMPLSKVREAAMETPRLVAEVLNGTR